MFDSFGKTLRGLGFRKQKLREEPPSYQPLDFDPTPIDSSAEPLEYQPFDFGEAPAEGKVENHRVTGTSFRAAAIKYLMSENDVYDLSKKELIEEGYTDERVYELEPYHGTATLEPEPDNPHDSKAIKVMADGVHIGYIKAGSCAHIHNLLREGRIKKAEIEIKGGAYKCVEEEYDYTSYKTTYTMERDSVPFHAILTLTLE